MPLMPNIDELRQYVETDLPDEVLESYMLDADAAITGRYGPNFADVIPPLKAYMHGGWGWLTGVPPVVTAIREKGVLLVAGTDYRQVGTYTYQRLPTTKGWDWEIEVDYAPPDDTDERKRVLVQLVKLSCQYTGFTVVRVGDLNANTGNINVERQAVLDSLRSLAPAVA